MTLFILVRERNLVWKRALVILQKVFAYDRHFSDVHLLDFLVHAETSFHIGLAMTESQDEMGDFCDCRESTDVKKILIQAILIRIKFWC